MILKKRCKVCRNKIEGTPAKLVVKTAEGDMELNICSFCEDFFDKSIKLVEDKNDEADRIFEGYNRD